MSSVSNAILALAAVALSGLLLGSFRIRGIGLGSAGVLFAGILFGHFGVAIDPAIAEFAKEFGLVLFVFMIGLQLGPGIITLWKQQGIVLNALALAVVSMGFGLVLVMHSVIGVGAFSGAGLFSGATTNTPSLGAAQQAASSLIAQRPSSVEGGDESDQDIKTLASAYAVAYPGGIVGIIASMLILRRLFRVNVDSEAQLSASQSHQSQPVIKRRSIIVDNRHLDGTHFGDLPGLEETGVRISRIQRHDEEDVHAANMETTLSVGDVIQVVGDESGLNRFVPLIGSESELDLMKSNGDAKFQRIVVTEPDVLNRTLRDLSLDHRFGVTVTRIRRSGVEMSARGSSQFHYGDIAHVVGTGEALERVTELLGNSVKSLNETQFAPIFLGIGIGVVVGMIPIQFPGLPFPVKLGLAGGPLIAAILFSLVGRIGRFVWYIPYSANLAIREIGIILFLACAGLSAGKTFFSIAATTEGVLWMAAGLVITMLPLLVVGTIAKLACKLNFLTICGIIAGSMTDPPALAFANSLSDSEACATAYAAVYPLTMVLRIVAAQMLVYMLV